MHDIHAKGILSAKNGMNLYRGCTHNCIYCDSRSTCYSMDHDFEDVAVKRNAPQLLEDALRRKRSRCMIGTGSMSDPYMPIEATEQLMRRCLEIIDRYGFGVAIQTKSDLVLRDLDLLLRIQSRTKSVVQITLTTLDEDLCRILEPDVCTTQRRVEVLHALQEAGIPTVVWICPLLPFLNDTEENLRGLMQACFDTGVIGIMNFGIGVTLREGDREYFHAKLDAHFPGLKQRYIQTFGLAYQCMSPDNESLMRIFHSECAKRGILHEPEKVFAYLHAFEDRRSGEQLSMF